MMNRTLGQCQNQPAFMASKRVRTETQILSVLFQYKKLIQFMNLSGTVVVKEVKEMLSAWAPIML
jgi:hypothetical protein